ncbi:MAG: Trm112 family protein [Nitrososphaerota archaeon]|nr:Trm112 family protein [Nitrososphaerota archaeon]
MKHRLLDLLACPMDKGFPLELQVLEEDRGLPVERDKVGCELYCSYKKRTLKDVGEDWVKNCRECMGVTVKEAVLLCPKCGRWYPVTESIPRMLPDELRSRKEDESFLYRHEGSLKREVKKRGPVGTA